MYVNASATPVIILKTLAKIKSFVVVVADARQSQFRPWLQFPLHIGGLTPARAVSGVNERLRRASVESLELIREAGVDEALEEVNDLLVVQVTLLECY